MLGGAGLKILSRNTGEAVGEGLVVPARRAAVHRLEDHAISLLKLGGAVPRAVEGDERAIAIAGREVGAAVEEERHRRPVARVDRNRLLLVGAAIGLLPVAAVLRCIHELLLVLRVVAVWPAEVVTLVDLD